MPGERLTVRVERMAPEGDGIAKAQGSDRIVFVPYGVPGDELEVELTETHERYARGRLLKLLKPGPERIEPPCPLHFNPSPLAPHPSPLSCGGCDWQSFNYAAQLKHKREIVVDCLRRIGRMKDVPVEPTLASPRQWAYRNKVQVPFGALARGGESKIIAGFYAVSSHQIVDANACPIQTDLSVAILNKVKELAGRFRWPIYDEKAQRGWLRHLFIRTNEDGKALVAVVTRSPEFPKRAEFVGEMRAAFPQIIGLHQNIQPLPTSVILGPQWKHLWGGKNLAEKIGPFTFMVSPSAFLQVNTPACEVLYQTAIAALTEGRTSFKTVLDLYCGVGTLSLFIAKEAGRVLGIEENRDAVRDAWQNARSNGVKNASFYSGKVEFVLPKIQRELPQPAAAVVDPPRAGLSPQVMKSIVKMPLTRLVYVSCDPATFARDAAFLAKSRFVLRKVQPVDLFPQTSHVELVGLFDRA